MSEEVNVREDGSPIDVTLWADGTPVPNPHNERISDYYLWNGSWED